MTRATNPQTKGDTQRVPRRPGALLRGLSSKFLFLTIAFVMLIEMLILVPSVANFRQTRLMSRLDQSQAALGVLDQTLGDEMLERDLLEALDAEAIVLRNAERTARIAKPGVDYGDALVVTAGDLNPFEAIVNAWRRLSDTRDDALIRLVGMRDGQGRQIEIVIRAMPLRDAMLVYMRNIVLISLFIAVVTALLVFAATRALLIRPVQELTGSMLAFAANPQDAEIIGPSNRRDELGQARRELGTMQHRLRSTLDQQRRLAELGLAVSKINHDMRNILSTAQLVSDRLADVDDPVVQRVAPRLIRALDRAVGYSESVLEYGHASDAAPRFERVKASALFEEVADSVLADNRHGVTLRIDGGETIINADHEQILRVLVNLARNAVQAMAMNASDRPRELRLTASLSGSDVELVVADTGAGPPDGNYAQLFDGSRRSSKAGGTGLGLAIAQELIQAHNGTIEAQPNEPYGMQAIVRLPR